MYTVRAEVLLEMRIVVSHETLKARGDIVDFNERMGSAIFVSHQWVAKQHPDPEFEQMPVLQDALRHLLYNSGSVSADWVTESFVPTAKGLPHKEFQQKSLFIWYDYFSVPQLEGSDQAANDSDGSQQAKAINSIPAYVAKCRFFFALCPTIDCSARARVLNVTSWSERGWCRLERAARELSAHDSWILVQGSTSLRMVGTVLSFGSGPVGEGEFTIEDDRLKLAPVMKQIVNMKLAMSLQAGDLPAYRRHLNLQTLYLTGLDTDHVCNVVPSSEKTFAPDCDHPAAAFLYQNGFRSTGEKDSAGFRPLHYAAMSGSPQVVAGLLARRANPNRRTTKAEPKLGFPPWMSALDMAIFYKHNAAAQLLIGARAQLSGGTAPAMIIAATSNNVDGIRLLRASGGDPLA
ncbi:ANKRD17, partial [Symbiodinium natans]